MKGTEHLQKEKNRIINTDRIIRIFAKDKNSTVSSKTINSKSEYPVHRSNAMRLLKNLVRLGVLKEVSRGKYTLSDYMLTRLNGKNINLFEIYGQVKEILEYHYNNNNNNNMPPKTKLTREDVKYLMLLDGLLICDNIIQEEKINQPNNIINRIKKNLEGKYGHKYIDRTIDKIQEVLEIHENKTKELLQNMKNNQIRNINCLGFMTSIDLKFNPSFQGQRTSIFDSLEDL